jgi:hypothetical protein
MKTNQENELYLEPSVEVSGDQSAAPDEPVIICVSGC